MRPQAAKPQLIDFEFTSQINNHFEISDPRIFQSVRIAPYEGPLDNSEPTFQDNLNEGSVLQEMMLKSTGMQRFARPQDQLYARKAEYKAAKFIIQCFS